MDIKSPEERSLNMAKIKSSNTKPEKYIRSLLYANGYRYRVNYGPIIGKPDLYFIGKRVAVFIHGCYWHRHPNCKYAYTPKSNVDFWVSKLDGNRQHDIQVKKELISNNIRVLIIWECTIKKMMRDRGAQQEILLIIESFINNPLEREMEV